KLSFNQIQVTSEDEEGFKLDRFEQLGLRISEINLAYNNIKSLPRRAFADLSAKVIDLRSNRISAAGRGTFTNLTLDELILSLEIGAGFLTDTFIDCNISDIYLVFYFDWNVINYTVDYYDKAMAKCFSDAPQLCSKSIHIPMCTDVLEKID